MQSTRNIFCSIWSLTLAPDTQLLYPLQFPGRWEVFSSNELTLGGFLDGAGHQKYQVMIRKLDFLALPSHFPDRGEELEMRLMIMSTY